MYFRSVFQREEGDLLKPVEITSGQIFVPEFLAGLIRRRELSDKKALPALLVYGGEQDFAREAIKVVSWRKLPSILEKMNV